MENSEHLFSIEAILTSFHRLEKEIELEEISPLGPNLIDFLKEKRNAPPQ
jgi:hypothetical protein